MRSTYQLSPETYEMTRLRPGELSVQQTAEVLVMSQKRMRRREEF